MTRNELRRRNGGDLSCVPGPVIMRAVALVMRETEEENR